MKSHHLLNRLKLVFACIFLISQSFAQKNITTRGFIIGFKDNVSLEEQKRIVKTIPLLKKPDNSLFLKSQNLTIATLGRVSGDKNLTDADIHGILDQIESFDEVTFANPLLVSENGHFAGTLGEFFVKLRSAEDFDKLQQVANETNTKILREYEYMPNVYILFADKIHRAMPKRWQSIFAKWVCSNTLRPIVCSL